MKKLVVSTMLVGCLVGSAFAELGRTPMTFENVGKAADCANKASAFRAWCIVNDWPKGKPEAPTKTLIGLAIDVPTYNMGTDAYKEALTKKVELVAFVVKEEKVTLHRFTKPAKGDEAMIADAITKVEAVLSSKAKSAAIKKELATQIAGVRASARSTKEATEVKWMGEHLGELRKIGAFWVAVEADTLDPHGTDRVRVVILTDAWQ